MPLFDLQPHIHRPGQRRALQHAQLLLVVDDHPQPVTRRLGELRHIEHALEQQDGGVDATRAQLQRLAEEGHREAVGLVVQRPRAAQRAVSVGVGLDHRERPPPWRSRARW